MKAIPVNKMLDRLRAVHHARSFGDPNASTIYRDAAETIDQLVKHQIVLHKRVVELENELHAAHEELGHVS